MKILFSILILITFDVYAQAGAVGTLNQIKKDPAANEFKAEREDLREVINDLDEPRSKPKEKSPNEVQLEKEEKRNKKIQR